MVAIPAIAADVRVGCDVQSVAEVSAALERHGERYLARVLSADERLRWPGVRAPQWLAARYAAKEAVLKLIGRPDGVDLRGISVGADASGRPEVALTGTALERHRAAGLGPIDLSLSHDAGVAFAVAVARVEGVHAA